MASAKLDIIDMLWKLRNKEQPTQNDYIQIIFPDGM